MIQVASKVDLTLLQDLAASADRVAIITDSNVARLLPDILPVSYPVITIPAGEENKTIATCTDVWTQMSALGMTRRSMIINVGGGMVTDLGGFCAATYMRGIRFVNVSTTLLGAVDASIGGKTGVDLGVMKNRVGVFALPLTTFIPLSALMTLPEREVLSGYAEMVKTGYISSLEMTNDLLKHPPLPLDTKWLQPMVKQALDVKEGIVSRDFHEAGERKCLNFGHTPGHAFEQLSLLRGNHMQHGIAVAHGILIALILSNITLDLPSHVIYRYASWLNETYPHMHITCDDYDRLLHLMQGDKKNLADGNIRFVLLKEIGQPVADCVVTKNDIKSALDIYRDLTSQ